MLANNAVPVVVGASLAREQGYASSCRSEPCSRTTLCQWSGSGSCFQDTLETPCPLINCSRQLIVLETATRSLPVILDTEIARATRSDKTSAYPGGGGGLPAGPSAVGNSRGAHMDVLSVSCR